LEEGAERIFLLKKNLSGAGRGGREKSLTHPKLPHRQVLIKKSKTRFFGWCVRGYWVTQARAYLIMIRGLFLFLITANSTRLDPLLLDLVICMQATLEGQLVR
jgi:hypothetical protein